MSSELPASATLRPFESAHGRHLFVVDRSRIYDLAADALEDEETLADLVATLDRAVTPAIDGTPLAPPPLQSLSLNVAQACNLSCGYCYADAGRFGGRARLMPLEVGRRAVDRLIAEAAPDSDLLLGFMGGEPFLNRRLIHAIAPYAEARAAESGHAIRFSLTTNGTLIEPDDAALLARHPFQVTVSLDGPAEVHDRQRRLPGDRDGAYAATRRGLDLLARHGRPRHLSARVTVTPGTASRLRPTLDHLLGLGFDEVGFAPVLVSPDPRLALGPDDFGRFLAEMVDCGEAALAAIAAGRRYPFANLEQALFELHRGSHRPYPCGAGAAYLSVSAEGGLYACHRLVDDAGFAFGHIDTGSDRAARARHLAARHVDAAEPCRGCWARYLCGGGCHHEVDRRGRVACDYIRGWLDFCLRAYVELERSAPLYFSDPDRHFAAGAATTAAELGRLHELAEAPR